MSKRLFNDHHYQLATGNWPDHDHHRHRGGIPACTLDNILEIPIAIPIPKSSGRRRRIIKNLSVDWKIIILCLYALAAL